MFCFSTLRSGAIYTPIIICLVLGLLLISSDFSSSADTSNACFNLASDRGLPGIYFSVYPVSSYLTFAPSPVKLIHRQSFGRIFSPLSVVRSTGSHRPEFLRRPVLGCTDFPHSIERDYPTAFSWGKL